MKVVAVVVAFGPQPELFAKVLESARSQTDGVVVADNGTGAGLDRVVWDGFVERLDMGQNAGVAAAQNAGVRRAFDLGATHALLLDHDSVAGSGMVDALVTALRRVESAGRLVAQVGANYKDPRRPTVSPFVAIKGFRLLHLPNIDEHAILPVSYLISSGSLISERAWKAIGPMEERLFIDYIDIEWGLRASAMGWTSYGVCGANLEHDLGDTPIRIFGRSYPFRGPSRHYYMVRNAAWLITQTSLPANWKFIESWRLLRRSMAYAIFAPKAYAHVAAMLAGLRDGLQGRLGERRGAIAH